MILIINGECFQKQGYIVRARCRYRVRVGHSRPFILSINAVPDLLDLEIIEPQIYVRDTNLVSLDYSNKIMCKQTEKTIEIFKASQSQHMGGYTPLALNIDKPNHKS